MKLNLRPQRCRHGRKGKMAPSSKQEAEEEGEVVMNIHHMEDEEVMNKEEGEVDVVATTMVAEGEEEEISIKEAGQMEGVEEEVATKTVVIEIRVSSKVAIMVATVVAIKVAVVIVASRHLRIQEVDTRVVDTSRTIDTKMVVLNHMRLLIVNHFRATQTAISHDSIYILSVNFNVPLTFKTELLLVSREGTLSR